VEAHGQRLDGHALHAARGVAGYHRVGGDEATDAGVVVTGSMVWSSIPLVPNGLHCQPPL
jgi:hypothetical protein